MALTEEQRQQIRNSEAYRRIKGIGNATIKKEIPQNRMSIRDRINARRGIKPVEEKTGGFLSRTKERFKEAEADQAKIQAREDAGEIGGARSTFRQAGETAQFIGDTGFDLLASGAKWAFKLLPDQVEDKIKRKSVEKTQDFFKSDTGKSFVELAQAGIKMWDFVKEKNPELAKDIEATAKLSEVIPIGKGLQFGGKAGGTVVRTGGEALGEVAEKTGKNLVSSAERQLIKDVEDIVSPKVTKKVKDEALKQKRVSDTGEITLSDFDKKMAETVAPFVKKTNTPQANIKSLGDEIGRISESLEDTLKSNDAIFNNNQLRGKLKSATSDLVDDLHPKAFEKAKDRITNLLMKEVKTNNLSGLWKARKKFDNIIDEQLKAFSGSPTVKKDLAKKIRNGVNDFIIEKSPHLIDEFGIHPFKDSMEKMSAMFRSTENIADKVLPSQLNQTTLNRLSNTVKELSHKAGILGIVGGGVGVLALPTLLSNPIALSALIAFGTYKVGKKVITSAEIKKRIGEFLIKSGNKLNPADKKHLEELMLLMGDAKNNEAGFAKIPGGKDKLTDVSNKQTFLSPDEISDIQIDATKKQMMLDDIGKKDNGRLAGASLAEEAKKYKTADEFIDAQSKVYRGVGTKGVGVGFGAYGDGLYVSNSIKNAKGYGEKISEFKLVDDIKLFDAKNTRISEDILEAISKEKPSGMETVESALKYLKEHKGEIKNYRGELEYVMKHGGYNNNVAKAVKDILQKKGYDGIKYMGADELGEGGYNYVIYNKDAIKTKSQLKQIWEKTNK